MEVRSSPVYQFSFLGLLTEGRKTKRDNEGRGSGEWEVMKEAPAIAYGLVEALCPCFSRLNIIIQSFEGRSTGPKLVREE